MKYVRRLSKDKGQVWFLNKIAILLLTGWLLADEKFT